MKIIIDIEVTNTKEVVKAHKGELVKLLSDVLLSKEKKKMRVERAVCQGIVDVLKVELPKGLSEELVEANINYKIVNGEEDNYLYV